MATIDISKFGSRKPNPYYGAGEAYDQMGRGGEWRYNFTKVTPARRIAKETDLLKLIKANERVDLIVTNGHVDSMAANFVNAIFDEIYKATGSTKALDRVRMNYWQLDDKRKAFKRKVLMQESPDKWSDPQQLLIPDIGTVLKLTEDWTFNLYYESRNGDLYARLWPNYTRGTYSSPGLFGGKEVKLSDLIGEVTLSKGAELKIDRVYIRKGADEYSSITFYAENGAEFKTGKKTIQEKKRRIRFWVKLGDANSIKCSMNMATVRTDG